MNLPTVTTRCGQVALIGRPNVGKSSLLNAILGEKIAATTHKPQTTQRQLRGVETRGDVQLIFVDTPGLHAPKKGLHAFMIEQALDAVRNVDVIAVVVEAHLSREKGERKAVVDRRDAEVLKQLDAASAEVPRILVINKIDALPSRDLLLPLLQQWQGVGGFAAVVPVSAHKKDGLDDLVEELAKALPFSEFWYDDDTLTTAGEREICAELIREKAMLELSQELPYKVAVIVEDFDESRRDDPKKPLVDIAATIHVERESQKGMVVGKGGARIKTIGARARKDLERLLGCQVMLNLLVRVEKNWTQSDKGLRKLGYS